MNPFIENCNNPQGLYSFIEYVVPTCMFCQYSHSFQVT